MRDKKINMTFRNTSLNALGLPDQAGEDGISWMETRRSWEKAQARKEKEEQE